MSQLHVFDLDISPCPLCEAHLTAASEEWRADQRCEQCGGVWISAERLERELKASKRPQFDAEDPSANFCPVCGPVPLDQGSLLGQRGLYCGSCQGVFLYKPLSARLTERTKSGSTDLSSVHLTTSIKIEESERLNGTVKSAQSNGSSEFNTHSESSSRVESREVSEHINLSDHSSDPLEISRVSSNPTEDLSQPKRDRSRVRLGAESTTSGESLKPDSSIDLNLIRDILWFGGLISVIGGSLWYWMTP